MSESFFCYRHPTVEVYLRCGKCERPICSNCTRHGPAGARCPECSSMAASPLYQVSGGHAALGAAAGVGSAFVLGYLLSLVAGFGFFQLWAGLLAGGVVGESVLRVTQRKRGVKMEVLTGLCALAGCVLSFMLWYARSAPQVPGATFETVIQMYPFYFGAMAVMVFAAISRVRFF